MQVKEHKVKVVGDKGIVAYHGSTFSDLVLRQRDREGISNNGYFESSKTFLSTNIREAMSYALGEGRGQWGHTISMTGKEPTLYTVRIKSGTRLFNRGIYGLKDAPENSRALFDGEIIYYPAGRNIVIYNVDRLEIVGQGPAKSSIAAYFASVPVKPTIPFVGTLGRNKAKELHDAKRT